MKAAVTLVQGRNATAIWPIEGRQLIPRADQVGFATDVDDIQVAAGDIIRFEVYANGNGGNEAVSWTPSIGYVESSTHGSYSSRNNNLPLTIAREPRSLGTH